MVYTSLFTAAIMYRHVMESESDGYRHFFPNLIDLKMGSGQKQI